MKINEVSRISGVSIRTLQYYDSIGLLKPDYKTESGYRIYNEKELKRLETILLFKELKFSLSEIKEIIDNPSFDVKQTMSDHIRMLDMEKEHIENLIEACKRIRKGESAGFSAFDVKIMENYRTEAKKRWGKTDAYKEFEIKTAGKDVFKTNEGLMNIFASFGELINLSADDSKVQKRVKELKQFISDNYYNCTDEILSCLGEMYVSDERFKNNIDKASKEGTALFVREAVRIYTGK